MTWPNDADGDVFRRLQQSGFDFGSECEVDFNIDFNHWPLEPRIRQAIEELYPLSEIYEPEPLEMATGDVGYVLVKVRAILTYEFVVGMQGQITKSVSTYGGWCNSWGVLH